MTPRRLAILCALALMFSSEWAFADLPLPDGHVKLTTGDGELIAPNGKQYFLPVGSHILDSITWGKVDVELKRLEDLSTRLTAENKSLKESAGSGAGWRSMMLVAGLAFLAGGVTYWYEFK